MGGQILVVHNSETADPNLLLWSENATNSPVVVRENYSLGTYHKILYCTKFKF